MKNILILYNTITADISKTMIGEFQSCLNHVSNLDYGLLESPSFFEIPHILNMACDLQEYDAVVIYINVPKKIDSYTNIILRGTIDCINDVAIHYNILVVCDLIKSSFYGDFQKKGDEDDDNIRLNESNLSEIEYLKSISRKMADRVLKVMEIKKSLDGTKQKHSIDIHSHSDKTH